MTHPSVLLTLLLAGCAPSGALAGYRGAFEALIWVLIALAALVILRAARRKPPPPE